MEITRVARTIQEAKDLIKHADGLGLNSRVELDGVWEDRDGELAFFVGHPKSLTRNHFLRSGTVWVPLVEVDGLPTDLRIDREGEGFIRVCVW